MSSASAIKNSAAKVAVKVPFPDSLIEVRMSPPESNFEVKVTPGGEVIELLIRPGCSQIEVRITQPTDKGEGRKTAPPETEGSEPGGKNDPEANSAPEVFGKAEDEVVPGVSKAEFAAMAEQDAADEAKKLLAEMEMSDTYSSPAGLELDREPPADAEKSPEGHESPGEPATAAPENTAATEEDPPPVADVPENEAMDRLPSAGDAPPEEPLANEAQALTTAEELPGAPAETPLELEAPPDDITGLDRPGPAREAASGTPEAIDIKVEDYPAATDEQPLPEPPAPEEPTLTPPPEETAAEPEYPSFMIMEDGFGDEPTAKIPEAVEEAARQALARLSSAAYEERSAPALERRPPAPAEPPAAESAPASDSGLPDQVVDRTIMVEYIEDSEAGPDHLPDDTATPLPEEDQMDLGSVETEDEELAIDPIDLDNVDLDLEKSRPGGPEEGQTVLKARPMVTAVPNNTIIPQ